MTTPRAGFHSPLDKTSEGEQEIKQLFETAPFLLVRIGFDGYLKRLNPAWSILGWSDEELLSRPWASFLIHPDDLERTRGAVGAMMSGTGIIEFEQRLMCKDGTWRWFSCSGRPRPEEGVFYGIGIDVTERKRVEAEVARLNVELASRAADLEAANKELEAFMHRVSHDLRSPLTSILLATDGILRRHGESLAPKAKESVLGILATTRRMNQIIDDLLRLSKVTVVPIVRERVDLTAMCQGLLLGLERTQPERHVVTNAQPGIVANADANLVRILLENLLGNAWKFTGKKEAARIEVGTTTKDGESVYFVKDNGIGFDRAQAGDLFVPFRRLQSAADFPGTGVGLSIVHRIVERHGGRIWVEATPGEGATFYFVL